MKRVLSLLLVAVFLLSTMTSCAGMGPRKRTLDEDFQILYDGTENGKATATLLANALADTAALEIPIVPAEEFAGELKKGKQILIGETGLLADLPALSAADGKLFSVSWHQEGLAINAIDAVTLHLAVLRVSELWGSSEEYGKKEDKIYINSKIAAKLDEATLPQDQLLSVMTQNVLNNHYDPIGYPQQRMPRFKALIELYSPDLLGLQEVGPSWYRYIQNNLGEEYGIIGETSDGKENYDSFRAPVLYKKDRFDLLDSGTFWPSDTPDVPSAFEGAATLRVCSWVKLKDKVTEVELVFANLHTDHESSVARKKQIRMVTSFLEKYKNECAVYLTGDFNTGLGDIYTNNVFPTAKDGAVNTSKRGGTFHDFSVEGIEIDFVFHNKAFSNAIEYHICDERFDKDCNVSPNGGYPSDHYGVITRFLPR